MSTYNIEMNSYNGSTYDQLYPRTYLSNILDWTSSIYSKTEVDNLISPINSSVSNIDIQCQELTRISIGSESSGSFVMPETVNNCFLVVFCGSFNSGYQSSGLSIYTSSSLSGTAIVTSGTNGTYSVFFQGTGVSVQDSGRFGEANYCTIDEIRDIFARTYYYRNNDNGSTLYVYGYSLVK